MCSICYKKTHYKNIKDYITCVNVIKYVFYNKGDVIQGLYHDNPGKARLHEGKYPFHTMKGHECTAPPPPRGHGPRDPLIINLIKIY